MPIVSLSKQTGRISVGSFELDSNLVFSFFDKLPASDRDDAFLKAINIGVLALMEDRLSSFLAKTSNELGTELESLKLIFEMKQEVFSKAAVKGLIAEEEIAEYLSSYLKGQGLSDSVSLTGSIAGSLKRNKTGDIVVFIDGDETKRVVIESKFDKALTLGDIATRDVFASGADTAWSQLIESQVNRDGKTAIIVFDTSSVNNTILKAVENVRFIPGVGFIVIVDSQRGDYKNLFIAYMLARDIAAKSNSGIVDTEILSIFVNRLIKDLKDILLIENLVKKNIENNKAILMQLHKSFLAMEFSKSYLTKYLSDGEFSKEDLLNFYAGDDIRKKFKDMSVDDFLAT